MCTEFARMASRSILALLLASMLCLCLPARAAVDVDALWDFGQVAASERRFRQAISKAQGDDLLLLRTQLARSLGLQKRFDAAHAELDAVAAQAATADVEVRVRLMLERGRVWRSSGEPARGLPLFESAFELADAEALYGLAADALHMVALALPAGAAQQAANQRVVSYARAATDPRAKRWEGQALNNLGDSLRSAGQLEASLLAFRESREVFARQRSPGGERIARWQVANVLRLLGRMDEALKMQQQLEAEHERGGSSDPYVFEELEKLHAALGDSARAETYSRKLAAVRVKP
jgi:hypothetical protein